MGFDRDWELGFWGHFWGKLGSFGVSLGPLEMRSHCTWNPMSFWVKICHFCAHSEANLRNPLYRVRLGLGIGIFGAILGQIWVFWGKFGSFGDAQPFHYEPNVILGRNPPSLRQSKANQRESTLWGSIGIGNWDFGAILGQIWVFWGKFGSFGDAQPFHYEPNVILGRNPPSLRQSKANQRESTLWG